MSLSEPTLRSRSRRRQKCRSRTCSRSGRKCRSGHQTASSQRQAKPFEISRSRRHKQMSLSEPPLRSRSRRRQKCRSGRHLASPQILNVSSRSCSRETRSRSKRQRQPCQSELTPSCFPPPPLPASCKKPRREYKNVSVRRVGGGVGWVLHGLCFELSDGTRVGEVLENRLRKKTSPVLVDSNDNNSLKRR